MPLFAKTEIGDGIGLSMSSHEQEGGTDLARVNDPGKREVPPAVDTLAFCECLGLGSHKLVILIRPLLVALAVAHDGDVASLGEKLRNVTVSKSKSG